jgi:hypothetical protein
VAIDDVAPVRAFAEAFFHVKPMDTGCLADFVSPPLVRSQTLLYTD